MNVEIRQPPLSAPLLVLLQRWQRGFPLRPRPFAEVARREGMKEAALLALLAQIQADGVISRIGAVVRPNTAGASTLAAMAVPAQRLEEVAALVSAQPETTHNYARDHELNLWFVVSAATRPAVAAALARIARISGLEVLDLPMLRDFHIDLGFAVAEGGGTACSPCAPAAPVRRAVSPFERRLLAAIEDGLALVPRPFAEVAARLQTQEEAVIAALKRLLRDGVMRRFGLVLHHRRLGFRANGMVVWDIADGELERAGQWLARQPCTTLCYARPRRLPRWRYNLFCMIHGRERAAVRAQVARLAQGLAAHLGMPRPAHEVLFSTRRYKQRGARFSVGLEEARGHG